MSKRHFLQIYHNSTQKGAEEQPLYSVPQVASMLKVSPSTIWRWVESGKLPAFRVGEKIIRIKVEDLEKVISPARKSQKEENIMSKPSKQEITRRKALVKKILANRERMVITPLTTTDLIHQVREQESRSYDQGS